MKINTKGDSKMKKRNLLKSLWIIFIGLALTAGSSSLAAVQSSPSKEIKEANKKAIIQKALKLNMPFIANQGQIKDERVRFYAKTFGGSVFITPNGEMVYSFPWLNQNRISLKSPQSQGK